MMPTTTHSKGPIAALAMLVASLWIPQIWAQTGSQKQVETLPAHRVVMNCIEDMGTKTSWGECVSMMFKACEGNEVGSEGHVACLTVQHDGWREEMETHRLALVDELHPKGVQALSQVMTQWFRYVSQRCSEVALGKPKVAAEAAQTGCEISEIVGVTTEFVACREGRSTAPYCTTRK